MNYWKMNFDKSEQKIRKVEILIRSQTLDRTRMNGVKVYVGNFLCNTIDTTVLSNPPGPNAWVEVNC